jgi:hypothetical protein
MEHGQEAPTALKQLLSSGDQHESAGSNVPGMYVRATKMIEAMWILRSRGCSMMCCAWGRGITGQSMCPMSRKEMQSGGKKQQKEEATTYHAGHDVHERLQHAAQLARDAGGIQDREQTIGVRRSVHNNACK